MRHADLLVLALTALALTPAASAFSADAEASTAAAADPAALVPPTPHPPASLPSAPLPALVDDAQAGDLPVALPEISAVPVGIDASAHVKASAGPGIGVSAGEAPPADDAPALTPSLADVDPVVVAAAVAAPLAVVAVGIATGGFGLRASWGHFGGWPARTLRSLLGVLSFGLFSRIERGELLDNPVRARVHEAVAQEPGLTISDVRVRAGIAWGTTVHHLRRLEANGLLVSVPQGGHRRYFVANTPAAAQRAALAALMQPTAHRIASLVAVQPGIDQSALCQTLGLNGPSASKHLGHFRGQGLIQSHRVGRRTVHHPTPGLLAALGAIGPSPILWSQAALATPTPVLVAAR